MVLSIFVIVLVGIVAYFNFAQGFFSATLSAIAAVLSSVLAVSYTEVVCGSVLHNGAPDVAQSLVLCGLFAVGYVVLRLIFDKLVPGNVRVPATVNAVGAGVMGLVAGTFCVGTFVLAVQMLPFGPTISFMGYTRYKLLPGHEVVLPSAGNGMSADAKIGPQMADATLDPAKQESTLFVPVDAAVLGLVNRLSDGGSLAGARPLASVHPDWPSELFGERLGQQTGNRRSAVVPAGRDPITVAAAFRPTALPTFDGYGTPDKKASETGQIRPPGYANPYPNGLAAGRELIPLVLRVHVASAATDDADHLFRFSLGAVRLTVRPDGDAGHGTDYYPVGTLEAGKVAVISRVDDFLFLDLNNGDGGFDAVFMVPPDTLVKGSKGGAAIAAGTFLTVKRTAVIDLSDAAVEDALTPDPKAVVLRSDVLKPQLPTAPAK